MIPFTQYLLPDGEKRQVSVERSTEIEALAHKVRLIGGRFEIELLRTGDVSLECLIRGDDPQVLSSAICSNGPGIELVVDSIVEQAYSSAVSRGLLQAVEEE